MPNARAAVLSLAALVAFQATFAPSSSIQTVESRIPLLSAYGPRTSRLSNGFSSVHVALPLSIVAPTKSSPAALMSSTNSNACISPA